MNRVENIMRHNEVVAEIFARKPKVIPKIFVTALQIKSGGYGEGDVICGTHYPELRKIAKAYASIPYKECEKLLRNELHEARFVALIILNHKFFSDMTRVKSLYLDNVRYVNNWDLVDCSAPHIIGKHACITGDNSSIYLLSNSDNLWKNRISIVATLSLIKARNFMPTIELCEKFIKHEHHLIHKACGWMLREISKHDPDIVINFIKEHQNISSIMKNYALEWIKKR